MSLWSQRNLPVEERERKCMDVEQVGLFPLGVLYNPEKVTLKKDRRR